MPRPVAHLANLDLDLLVALRELLLECPGRLEPIAEALW